LAGLLTGWQASLAVGKLAYRQAGQPTGRQAGTPMFKAYQIN